ncbi:MAG: hypothetical protein ACLP7P_02245 [Rhodomicrobium sp.]
MTKHSYTVLEPDAARLADFETEIKELGYKYSRRPERGVESEETFTFDEAEDAAVTMMQAQEPYKLKIKK